ncbi:MAG: hypothetical protein GQ533_01615, partial [Methanosarcinaceae archaeon]|nr:hypothetical protein [Methanosarcinaceae archaeon]
NRTTTLIGTIGFEGEITIGYAENVTLETSAPEPDGNVTSIPDVVEEPSEPHVPYDPIDEILKWLGFGSKR